MPLTPQRGTTTSNIKLKILIQGQPKVGKSLNAATTSPRPLLLDFKEGWDRSHALLHPEIDYLAYGPLDRDPKNPGAYKKFAADWNDIKNSSYETLIFDSLGSFQDAAQSLVEADNGGRDLQIQDWGKIKNMTNAIIEEACCLDKHLIVIAHERDEYVRPKNAQGKPDLNSEKVLIRQTVDCIGDRDRQTFQKHFDIYCRAVRNGSSFQLLMAPAGVLLLGHRFGTVFNDWEPFNISGLIAKIHAAAKRPAASTASK